MSKREHNNVGPLIPLKKCKKCGEETVITHTGKNEIWCYKCGNYGKVEKE